MLGVVLWSDAEDRKAVIWCEDQGDLAFFNEGRKTLCATDFFDAGDLVQFDIVVNASMRQVHNPRLIVEQVGPELPRALRNQARTETVRPDEGKIIAFRPKPERPQHANDQDFALSQSHPA